MAGLSLAYSEHLCAARRAYTLCSWLLVLHGYLLRVLDLNLLSALHAVGLHQLTPPLISHEHRAQPGALSTGLREAEHPSGAAGIPRPQSAEECRTRGVREVASERGVSHEAVSRALQAAMESF